MGSLEGDRLCWLSFEHDRIAYHLRLWSSYFTRNYLQPDHLLLLGQPQLDPNNTQLNLTLSISRKPPVHLHRLVDILYLR